jgi:hypothetical protein
MHFSSNFNVLLFYILDSDFDYHYHSISIKEIEKV